MSFTVTDAFIQQFSGNVRALAQQGISRLRPCVIEEPVNGEAMYIEQVAPTVARKVQARHSDSPIMNTQHLRRRLAPYSYDWGDMVDKLDKLPLLIDPVSTYAINGAKAMARAFDDEIIAAFFGTAYTGHNGATAVTWPNGNSESVPTTPAGLQVAVNDWTYGNGSGNSGLTISKLISARMALLAAEGDDEEECYITVTARALGQLLATTEATSADYSAVKALNEGKIDKFMGFNFRHSERMQTNGSGYWRLAAWRKTGMGLGIEQDIETQVSQRPDKRFSWYVYMDEMIGATRVEEAKVVELICL